MASVEYSDLVITATSAYDGVWFDRGTGAERYGGFWNPRSQGSLRPLGSVGVESYDDINGNRRTLLVGANLHYSRRPAVASPAGYTQIWNDRAISAKEPVSFWRPVPPKGYVSLGDVAQKGWDEPDVYRIWCLRDDLAVGGRHAPKSFWDTTKSKAEEMSVWEIQPVSIGPRDSSSEALALPLGNFRNVDGYSAPDASLASVVVLPVEGLINTK